MRDGDGPKIIRDMITANPDIAALVLGAAASGAPGALVTHFTGADAGALTVPIMIIPGSLTREQIGAIREYVIHRANEDKGMARK